jgi:hypothetical protein
MTSALTQRSLLTTPSVRAAIPTGSGGAIIDSENHAEQLSHPRSFRGRGPRPHTQCHFYCQRRGPHIRRADVGRTDVAGPVSSTHNGPARQTLEGLMHKWTDADDEKVSRTLGWICAVLGSATAFRIVWDVLFVKLHPAWMVVGR